MASDMMIGPYTIIEELGRGGMATVYKGHDPKFDREVAIKILPLEMMHNRDFRTRFEREGRTVASLEHSAIVPVYDVGEADGRPYLVMRLMSGGSLADRIEQGQIKLADAVKIVERVAAGLQAAHDRGIIHRDLKPGNILFDHYNNAFLSDFGIVKLREATSNLTLGVIGTPGYMAPEMMEDEQFDHRVDIYALTITLYEMLAGELPFRATTPAGIFMAHINKSIPDIRVAQPDLPKATAEVIRRGMAKTPTERYQTATQLSADLRSVYETGATTVNVIEKNTQTVIQEVVSPSTILTDESVPIPPADGPPKPRPPRPIFLIGGGGVLLFVVWAGVIAMLAALFFTREPTPQLTGVAPTAPQDVVATTAGATATIAPTMEATQSLSFLAMNGVSEQSDWTPYTQTMRGVEMVLVPTGCFRMGYLDAFDDEKPEHQFCIEEAFWLDRTEVSNGMYTPTGNSATDELPVQSITWFDALKYCQLNRPNGRLPTEAEWEFAASGPNNNLYPYGNVSDGTAQNSCDENCTNDTFRNDDYNDGFAERAPVGSFPQGASWVGALDMSGNVSEWTFSVYLGYPYTVEKRELSYFEAPEADRAYRGGSYSSAEAIMRTSWRNGIPPESAFTGIGFRCAADFDPSDLQ